MLHTELPIYKAAYELLRAVTDCTRNMPRDLKRNLGEKISQEVIDIELLVFRANVARDKTPYLDKLIERQQSAELLIRLSLDMRAISPKQYATIVELTGSIGKQARGWRRASASPAG